MNLTTATPRDVLNLYLAETILDATTIEQYRVTLSLVEQWAGAPTAAELFSKPGILAFRTWLLTGRAASTVCGKLAVVRMLWSYACDEWDWPQAPPRGRKLNPKVPKLLPTAWAPGEFARILSKVEHAPVTAHWNSEHWACLLNTLWYSGARITGLLGCRLADLSGDVLTLPAEDDKTDTEKRRKLPPDLASRLVALSRTTDSLFDFHRSLQTLRQHYRRILLAAGLTASSRDLFHKVRRSSATAVAASQGPEAARQHLGHPDVRMTMARYIDASQLPHQATVPAPR